MPRSYCALCRLCFGALASNVTRVLVTGGAGFIGSHTVDALLHAGYEVRILDNLQPRVHPHGRPKYLQKEAEFIRGSVTEQNVLARAMEDVDYILHLAAYQDYLPDFSTFIHVNSESSALIFELIVRQSFRVRKIVFASSQAVAGEGLYVCATHGTVEPDLRGLDQLERGDWEIRCPKCGLEMKPSLIPESVCRPHTAYGISKYTIELLAKNLGERYGISTACMRYTYVQGSRNSFFNAYSGICRTFGLRIMNGLPPICYEDGNQLRDYVNVADVARANVIAMEAAPETLTHAVYNVGGGKPITVTEFADAMLAACTSTLRPSTPGIFRIGDTRHTVSDLSAMAALGWQPTVSIAQSIREYLDWFSGYKDTKVYLDEADRVMQEQHVLRTVRH